MKVTLSSGLARLLASSLALKANEALKTGEPLVLETEQEKCAVRSYAEREYSYLKAEADGPSSA